MENEQVTQQVSPKEVGSPYETTQVELNVENVTTFLASNISVLESILETDVATPILQKIKDKAVTQGIETFKAKSLDKLVNQKLAELNPEESEVDKVRREMQAQFDAMALEKEQARLELVKLNYITESGLPRDYANFIQGDTDEAIRSSIDELVQLRTNDLNVGVAAEIQTRFKENAHTPNGESKVTPTSKQFSEMTMAEKVQLQATNPILYAQLRDSAFANSLKK